MNFFKKFIKFLQKIGILKIGAEKKTYRVDKDHPYKDGMDFSDELD